jgi:phage baseplate assembly protein W
MPIPTVFKSYEVDNFPDKAVGILLPFNGNAQLINIQKGNNFYYKSPKVRDVGAFKLSYSTEEQAISNLVNLLLTRKGERLMQPIFGSRIPEFLFEPNSQKGRDDLRDSVQEDIEFWLPYINVLNISVLAQSDANLPDSYAEHNVIIQIQFKVTEIGANRTVTVFLDSETINFEVV